MKNKYPYIKRVGEEWHINWSETPGDYSVYDTYNRARRDMKQGIRPLRFSYRAAVQPLIDALNVDYGWTQIPEPVPMESVTFDDIDYRLASASAQLAHAADNVAHQVDIDVVTGASLDNIAGLIVGENRQPNETDEEFRRRLLEAIRGG